ncbi:hypothetical protein JMN32_08705 [Fulvivirga sp. 29W222]|uniref:Uncharacterized protein n=1 Tax=Fulvivirga marina TaxID=2494733 RepID=A0A937FXV5_9BACT|nr:hypothetical protein [Fulvivirga marina]MBL6446385.1 hypothetical protein [Fulvivirga marina]
MITYKPHYACFDCRKAFKRRLLKDIEGGINKQSESYDAKCPECGNLMADMGLDFEVPSKKDIKAWNHVKDLYKIGVTFHSCGCTGPGYIPKDKQALILFLREKREKFLKHRNFWASRVEPKTESEIQKDWNKNSEFLWVIPDSLKTGSKKNRKIEIGKAVDHWTQQLADIDSRIQKITNVQP